MRASIVPALVAVLCPLLGAASAAAADEVRSEYGAELALGPASVDVEVRRDAARVRVRYEVRNDGPLPDEAAIDLVVPAGVAVTGLRYQPRRGAPWLDARLLPAEDATAQWESYATAPFAAMRGPALVEAPGGAPTLRLLFVPARDRVVVEYTLTAPVCHAAGMWITPLPAAPPPHEAQPRVAVRGPRGAGRLVDGDDGDAGDDDDDDDVVDLTEPCSETAPADAWSGERFAVVAAPPAAPHGVEARMVMVPAGRQAQIVEVAVDIAAQLAPAPRDAHVVFVVDASISMGARGVAAQLELMKAYLARAPGARFEVVVYRREATPLFGRWRDGAEVAQLVADAGDAAFAVGNGSNLDAGLARAAALLARVRGARRVVAFTDDRVREALDADVASAALAGLPPDAVVHVVGVDGGGDAADGSTLDRELAHWLAPVAARWGGITAWATVGGAAEPAPKRADVFEELVRPRWIEGVVFEEGSGLREEIGELEEGTSVRILWRTENSAVTVRGFIWGKPWEPELVTSEPARRRVAALAVADLDVTDGLERDALRALATIGHAVSDATSLWADDPRWAPGGLPPEVVLGERVGLDRIGSGYATCSTRCRAGIVSRTSAVAARERPELAALLRGGVAACAARAGITTWNVALQVETTGREVVDVRLLAGGDDDELARCVVEAGWALALPEEYASWTATFEVSVVGDSVRR